MTASLPAHANPWTRNLCNILRRRTMTNYQLATRYPASWNLDSSDLLLVALRLLSLNDGPLYSIPGAAKFPRPTTQVLRFHRSARSEILPVCYVALSVYVLALSKELEGIDLWQTNMATAVPSRPALAAAKLSVQPSCISAGNQLKNAVAIVQATGSSIVVPRSRLQ